MALILRDRNKRLGFDYVTAKASNDNKSLLYPQILLIKNIYDDSIKFLYTFAIKHNESKFTLKYLCLMHSS